MNLSKIVDSIAAKAAENNPPNEQDYIVDGCYTVTSAGPRSRPESPYLVKSEKSFACASAWPRS